MMKYLPLTDNERKEMLESLGVSDIKELFSDIPQSKSYYSLDELPPALPEERLIDVFKKYAVKNKYQEYLAFLGGGAYNHFVPEVVNALSGKGELLTPYTPYQPEVSQGSLQAMFEYQTMMTMLTGLDVSNSSLYDGGTAAAEGVLLAVRKSKKNKILVAGSLHPEYIEIINTYIQNLGIEAQIVGFDKETGKLDLDELTEKLSGDVAGCIFQSPNFLGVVEETKEISEIIHSEKGYSIQVIAEAMSLAMLTPPGECGVDIAVGEAQSFGLPLGFGGPYLGFMVVKKDFIRQMPGRLVGQTVDQKGRRGYVLTLSTREQHIKREKATSNICTNQAWCAMRAGIYLATMGKKGLRDISKANHLGAAYFVKEVEKFDHVAVKYKKNFYNEVVLQITNMPVDDFLGKLEGKGILCGIPLHWFYKEFENCILVNFTELHKKEDIDKLVKVIGELK